jgi:hypothetical protein
MNLSLRMWIYLLLTIVGGLLPWYYNLQALSAGYGLADFIRLGFANPVNASLSADLLIGSTACLAWMIIEARRLKMRHWWIYIVLFYNVAFAFGYPLFLFMRERKMASGPSRA